MINKAEEIITALKTCKNPLIFMDSRADFDSLCSCIIMHEYLTNALGKNVYVAFDGVIPNSLKKITNDYADSSFIVENVCPAENFDFSKYDLLIFMDTGNMDHICKDRKPLPTLNIKKIDIDHHDGNPLYGNLNFFKPFASCCSVLFNLFQESGTPINKSLVNIYYIALLTDSGFFQFSTITGEDFQIAAELVKMGAANYEITWKLSFNESLETMKLKALVYSNLKFIPELKVAYSTISLHELEQRKIDFDQVTYSAADMIKRLENTKFVFVIREDDANEKLYKLSFRSHLETCDVNKLAKLFNGGGHKMAAGGFLNADNMDQAIKMVLDKARLLNG